MDLKNLSPFGTCKLLRLDLAFAMLVAARSRPQPCVGNMPDPALY